MAQLWGGRFTKETDDLVYHFNASVRFDKRFLQEDIEGRTFTATAGGGMIEVEMTGKKTLTSVKIKPEVVNPDDVEMLEDLVMSAVNECVKSIEETSEKEMSAVTGGVSLPGIL